MRQPPDFVLLKPYLGEWGTGYSIKTFLYKYLFYKNKNNFRLPENLYIGGINGLNTVARDTHLPHISARLCLCYTAPLTIGFILRICDEH